MQTEKKFNKTAYDNKFISEKYDRVNLTMPKGKRQIIQEHAKKCGESTNEFINRAIVETMERDSDTEKGEDSGFTE